MNKLNYRLLIVDDNPDSLIYILMSLKELPFINDEIKIVQKPIEALEYIKENEVDIIMLDMDLGEADLDGVKLARLIPNPPIMVACTAHADYIFKANEAGIYTYFSKKISFNALKAKMLDVVDKVDKKLEMQNRNVNNIVFKDLQNNIIDIEVDQIYYAYVDNDIINIFLEDIDYQFKGNLSALQMELSATKFARPRNNTLVNLAKVDLVRPDEIYLLKPRNGIRITMTRSFKENFRHQYEVYKQNNK